MKKNNSNRVAALLLVLVLMTCCFVGGTLAKYVTSVNSNDKVRVAHWGFKEESINIEGLFANMYKEGYVLGWEPGKPTTNKDEATVVGEDKDDVIAPGTYNSASFKFNYDVNTKDGVEAPEVDYNFSVIFDTTGSDVENLDANPNFKWTLSDDKAGKTRTYPNLQGLKKAVEDLAGKGHTNGTKKYEAGTLPPAFNANDQVYTIGWTWDFETADNAETAVDETAKQDGIDTIMGNMEDLNDLTITITIKAEQID